MLINSGTAISYGSTVANPVNANKVCSMPTTKGMKKINLICFAIAFFISFSLLQAFEERCNAHDLHVLLLIV